MKLFRLNEDYEAVPEKDTIMLVPEFAKLWTVKYNRMPGDVKGIDRRRGKAEILYLYFYCDYRSEFSELSDQERREAALDAAGLDYEYKISAELKDAEAKYIAMQETRELKLIKAAYNKVDRLQEYMNSKDEIDDDNYKAAMDSISKIGNLLKGLKELEIQVRKQESGNKGIRGGQESGFLKA
jgi:hypothetical protein